MKLSRMPRQRLLSTVAKSCLLKSSGRLHETCKFHGKPRKAFFASLSLVIPYHTLFLRASSCPTTAMLFLPQYLSMGFSLFGKHDDCYLPTSVKPSQLPR